MTEKTGQELNTSGIIYEEPVHPVFENACFLNKKINSKKRAFKKSTSLLLP